MNAEQKASLDALRASSAEREWRKRAEAAEARIRELEAELNAALNLLSQARPVAAKIIHAGGTVETNMGDWG